MALTVHQQKEFRRWMIKSASVPILSVLCLIYFWSWEGGFSRFPADRGVEFHFVASIFLLFGGFPIWNIILEKDRLRLAVYHGIHFMACYTVFFVYEPSHMIPAPAEFCLILGSWCLAKEGLGLLMPETHQRVEDLVNWRRDTLDKMIEAHYYTGSETADKD